MQIESSIKGVGKAVLEVIHKNPLCLELFNTSRVLLGLRQNTAQNLSLLTDFRNVFLKTQYTPARVSGPHKLIYTF